jgi:hypothetical protein
MTQDNSYDTRAFLMDAALEAEKRNWKARAQATLLLVIAGGYFFGFGVLPVLFSITVHQLPFVETTWFSEWVVPVPTVIVGMLGAMDWVASDKHKNEIMELSEQEIAQIDGSPGVWYNLTLFGRVLLIIFGSALVLGIIATVLRCAYELLT